MEANLFFEDEALEYGFKLRFMELIENFLEQQ